MIFTSRDRVQQLADHVKQTQADIKAERELKQRLREREKLIADAPDWITTDFWCGTCGEDRHGVRAYKVVQSDWTQPGQRIAYYIAVQTCHKGLRRYITDKHTDPYYRQSAMLRLQQQAHRREFLRPGDPGFSLYYPNAFKKYEDQMERQERADWHHRNAT